MQSHIGMDYPNMEDYEKSIVEFANTGVNVMMTELICRHSLRCRWARIFQIVLRFNAMRNPYPDGLPAEVSAHWNARMDSVMNLYRKHSDVITRITFWGTQDGMSWKNDFPMHRTHGLSSSV